MRTRRSTLRKQTGKGAVKDAIGAFMKMPAADRSAAVSGFMADQEEADEEAAGVEWLKEDNEKKKAQLGEMGKNLQGVMNAAAPGFDALAKMKAQMAALKKGGRTTRRNTSSGGDIVSHMLTIRNQVKLYHWQTGSFARHNATDDLTASLDEKIDQFVEVFMGKYGRPKVSGTIKLHNFSDTAAKSFVAKETKYLTVELPKKLKSSDTDLLNIRDEVLGDLNKVLYLFTLA